jgi:hypothetical protein
VVAAGVLSLWVAARSSPGMDFYQMWVGGRAATGDFYSAAGRARIGAEYLVRAPTDEDSPRRQVVARYRAKLETVSTPLLYTVFGAFRGTYEGDLLRFQLLVFLALGGWVALLALAYRYSLVLALAFSSFLLFVFEPVRSDIRVANMNHIILLLVMGSAWCTVRSRFATAAVLLAFSTLLKPYTILVFAVVYGFWIVRGRWRDTAVHAGAAAGTAAAALLASSAYFGSWTIWWEWLRDFRAMPPDIVTPELGNFAFVRLVVELMGWSPGILMLVLLGGGAIFVARKAETGKHADVLAIGLGCVLFQFVSPLVWVHHFLLSLPLMAYLLPRRPVAAVAALALTSVGPWSALFPSALQVAAISNLGLLIAYGAGLAELASRGVDGELA